MTRVAHFDCCSGISGDMVLGAVIDAGVPAAELHAVFNSLNLPITLEIEPVKRCGLAATKATIVTEDQEAYRFLPDIEAIVNRAAMTTRQKGMAGSIFRRVAIAEAAVHGMPVEKVHFHEVGALDSIADVIGTAVGLDLLGVERFTASSVPTGSGTVKCAHGIMPVPAPATVELLKGVPLAKSSAKIELTTPTGAAILSSVVKEFTDSPAMTIETVGHGAGAKDLIDQPNILRLFIGTAAEDPDDVVVLETNLDDCPGEALGYTMEKLFEAGALDVYFIPVHMKKNRPGTLLSVIAKPQNRVMLEEVVFRETRTFGIRRLTMSRTILEREAIIVETRWGPVKAKRGWRAGIEVVSPEFEDCVRVSREYGIPLNEVYRAIG